MLTKIMAMLESGERLSTTDIAKRLNQPETIVKSAMMQLEKMGYIENTFCSDSCMTKCDSCDGCPFKTNISMLPKIWSVVE